MRPVRGEYETGCWFLAPMAAGQMSSVFTPCRVRFSGTSTGRPLSRSMRSAQFVDSTNFSADSSVPSVRSST